MIDELILQRILRGRAVANRDACSRLDTIGSPCIA